MGNQQAVNGAGGTVGGAPGSGQGAPPSARQASRGVPGGPHPHQHQQNPYGGGRTAPGGAGGPYHTPYGYQPNQQASQGGAGGVPRSTSDTSMSNVETPGMLDSSGGAGVQPSSSAPAGKMDLASLAAADDDTVPTVFRWEHGGRQVYITGTFNGWSRQIPMHRSGNDFTYIHNLRRGKHAFKFIVDDEWRFAPDQPTVADIEGRINNFIDVTDFKPYTGDRDFEKEKAAAEYGCYSPPGGGDSRGQEGGESGERVEGESKEQGAGPSSSQKADRDGEVFSHTMPDLDEYTKEPPPLPPHLRHIILNKPPQLQDTAALPVPQHVALNHLYCTAIKDNMMVLGITQRFKTKFVTTVYYSPCT